jgi:hypothetical protein
MASQNIILENNGAFRLKNLLVWIPNLAALVRLPVLDIVMMNELSIGSEQEQNDK